MTLERFYIFLHEFKASLDFMLVQHLFCLVVCEKKDQFFLHYSSSILVFVSETFPFVLDLILNDIFDDILKRHDTNILFRRVLMVVLNDLSHDSNMSETFLEIA